MAKITALAALTALADGDLSVFVDISDLSMAPSGTDKKVTFLDLITNIFRGLTELGTFSANSAGNQASGTLLTARNCIVNTVGGAGYSVKLPVAVTSMRLIVFNRGANSMRVFPNTSAAIDALAANASIDLLPGQWMEFVAESSTQWRQVTQWTVAAQVSTTETQVASTAYGNLTTVGPTVSMYTGTEAVVEISMLSFRAGSGNTSYMSIDVSGATTIAAADSNSIQFTSPGSNFGQNVARPVRFTGLTPGINVFTAKYRNDGGTTWSFANRSMRGQRQN